MSGGGQPDFQAFREKMQPFIDERDKKLQGILTAEEYKHLFLELAKLKFSPEELERRFHEPNGHTTAEVLARLNRL